MFCVNTRLTLKSDFKSQRGRVYSQDKEKNHDIIKFTILTKIFQHKTTNDGINYNIYNSLIMLIQLSVFLLRWSLHVY